MCVVWSGSGSLTAAVFTNGTAITIPNLGSGSPYPSTINVSGMAGLVSKVTVKLNQFTHTYPDDVDVLLIGPGGQSELLLSDVGGAVGVSGVTVTLDDAATQGLPDSTRISTGTYKPTNVGAGDTFAAPAPAGPYGALLSVFNGAAPNGVWALYVVDDEANDQGTIAGGWTLTITTTNSASPVITAQPASQSVGVGSNTVFTVTATGTAPLSYQWRFNGGAIAGASNTSLPLSNVQPADAGSYTVVVSNSAGSATSAVAALTVLVPPAISAQPQSLTNVVGTTASFSATATGTAPLSYQWRLNGVNLANGGRVSGATTNVLNIANVQPTDAGSYTLVASNAGGSVTSAAATLTVNGPPVITAQPRSQSVLVGANVSLNVMASGTLPLNYQWFFNGNGLTDGGHYGGVSTPTLFITNALPTEAGGYSVVVTNVVGSVTSSLAMLAVSVPGSCAPPPANLVGWWPGEGNANDIASTNNGLLQGGVTANAAGNVGQAFSFDGTNNYVQIPNSAALRPTNLTIEAWVRFQFAGFRRELPRGPAVCDLQTEHAKRLFRGVRVDQDPRFGPRLPGFSSVCGRRPNRRADLCHRC